MSIVKAALAVAGELVATRTLVRASSGWVGSGAILSKILEQRIG